MQGACAFHSADANSQVIGNSVFKDDGNVRSLVETEKRMDVIVRRAGHIAKAMAYAKVELVLLDRFDGMAIDDPGSFKGVANVFPLRSFFFHQVLQDISLRE